MKTIDLTTMMRRPGTYEYFIDAAFFALSLCSVYKAILFVFYSMELHAAISANQIPRYTETLWNSRVEGMGQLREKCDIEELKELFDACLQRILPLLKVLNLAQKDDTTWLELIEAFKALIPCFDDVGSVVHFGKAKKNASE